MSAPDTAQTYRLVRVVVPAVAGSSPVAHPSKGPAKRALSRFLLLRQTPDWTNAGKTNAFHRGKLEEPAPTSAMAKSKRANGAGSVSIKYGSYYGRWLTDAGGHANRRLVSVRRPGTRKG